MALNQTNKLVWIVDTIYRAGKITFEALNEKWMNNVEMSGGVEMDKRTFHKWKVRISDSLGLDIVCEKRSPYLYYIENVDDMKSGGVVNWLINTYSVANSLSESKSIRNRILLENVPSGREYLDSIIEAMKANRFIHVDYYNYWKDETREHYLMPLCVKLFRQRWYMVGRSWPQGKDILLCLDRFRDFRLSSKAFVYPEDFDPQMYFDGCFGVIVDERQTPEDILLKVSPGQSNYLRDLPMHSSQEEVERSDEYSIFKLHVRPSFDFQQELLWNRDELEVLEPQWLREEMKGIIERMGSKY